MMARSMFSRLMTVFLAVILVCSAVLMGFFYMSTRDSLIAGNVSTLMQQAREMAYLSSMLDDGRVLIGQSRSATTERYLKWKAQQIYDRFGAYCIVISRSGQKSLYANNSILSDEELLATLNTEDMNLTLSRVLAGEEITKQTTVANGSMYTVAVPWMQDANVLGAVVIQTAAQAIRASYEALIWPALIATAAAFLVAALLCSLFARQVTQPLTQMELAAQGMARGDFSVRAMEKGSRETQSLARSFNAMAGQLEELESSRKEFVANVSHELRSPITSIQGYMQSMLDGTSPPESQGQYMQVVLDETRRLSKLINGLLNLSRMERKDEPLALTDYDLNEMSRRVLITKMNQIDDKRIEVEADFGDEPCFVRADADQIEQVLINLVDNALKFTPEGGHLALKNRTEGNTVFMTVSDDGCGILPEDQKHVFDRFYKADKAHTVGKGTGLGLSISKCILDKHGQSIRLVPSEKGATFEFTLEKGKQSGGNHAGQGESKT